MTFLLEPYFLLVVKMKKRNKCRNALFYSCSRELRKRKAMFPIFEYLSEPCMHLSNLILHIYSLLRQRYSRLKFLLSCNNNFFDTSVFSPDSMTKRFHKFFESHFFIAGQGRADRKRRNIFIQFYTFLCVSMHLFFAK